MPRRSDIDLLNARNNELMEYVKDELAAVCHLLPEYRSMIQEAEESYDELQIDFLHDRTCKLLRRLEACQKTRKEVESIKARIESLRDDQAGESAGD